jgi:hypothetical protein
LKLDPNFDFPMYNEELNANKLDNWMKKVEVYCRVQIIMEEDEKLQLATL